MVSLRITADTGQLLKRKLGPYNPLGDPEQPHGERNGFPGPANGTLSQPAPRSCSYRVGISGRIYAMGGGRLDLWPLLLQ